MQPLLENPHPCQPETFGSARELLLRASHHEPQPPMLLITCADAGLLAERLTENNPDGFCFASGLGAFVPPASDAGLEHRLHEFMMRMARESRVKNRALTA